MKKNNFRFAAYDLLRIICAFLVIVTHTNSMLFKASSPENSIWWFSVCWFYFSKIAVPIFVIISGACLLAKNDSFRKTIARILRTISVLLIFSYGYYLYDAWVNYGLWPRAVQFGNFLKLVKNAEITDSFWYLYFYIALMILLPFLQRFVHACTNRLLWIFTGLCFAVGSVFPLIVHYLPGLSITEYCSLPQCTAYLGLFLFGYLIKQEERRISNWICISSVTLSILLCVMLTAIEYTRANGVDYWKFLDDRMSPSVPVCVAACAGFIYVCNVMDGKTSSKTLTELGGCSFAVYLVQDFVIANTVTRLWPKLSVHISLMPAMLLWEIIVFIISVACAFLLRRIPLLKKLL